MKGKLKVRGLVRKIILPILIMLWLCCPDLCYAQNHRAQSGESPGHAFYPHSLMLFVGYTIVPKSNLFDEKQTILVPTIGIDYVCKFIHKMGIGLLNDLQLASYQVALKDAEGLKREYAFVTSLVFMYEPFRWWSVFAQPG